MEKEKSVNSAHDTDEPEECLSPVEFAIEEKEAEEGQSQDEEEDDFSDFDDDTKDQKHTELGYAEREMRKQPSFSETDEETENSTDTELSPSHADRQRDQLTTMGKVHYLINFLGAIVYDAAVWLFDVNRLAVHYVRTPLTSVVAACMAICILLGACVILTDMVAYSANAIISPLCTIPGVQWIYPNCSVYHPLGSVPLCRIPGFHTLAPSWCPPTAPVTTGNETSEALTSTVEDLMRVQGRTLQVLEYSVQTAGINQELVRSELVMRQLRANVKYSELKHRDDLLPLFDGYIDNTVETIGSVTDFHIRCHSLSTRVISINYWTLIRLREMEKSQSQQIQFSFTSIISWLLSPPPLKESTVFARYIGHISDASQVVGERIDEAEATLKLLKYSRGYLADISHYTSQEMNDLQYTQPTPLQQLWTLVAGSSVWDRNREKHINTLGKVETQLAVSILVHERLLLELTEFRAGLNELKRRFDELKNHTNTPIQLPLSVHIDIINDSIKALQAARAKAKSEGDARSKAIRQGKLVVNEPFIEAKGGYDSKYRNQGK
jgi:hypothetical protein